MGLQIEAKLAIVVSQDPPQSLQNPIFCPRCLPRGSKVAPKRPPNSILELLGLDFGASRLNFKASRARFSSYFGSTGPKKEDMYFLSDASTFGCWLFDLQFFVFCFLLFAACLVLMCFVSDCRHSKSTSALSELKNI